MALLWTSRPIRRGKLFKIPAVKKQSFFRHIKDMTLSTVLQKIELDYWTSASMAKGILVTIDNAFLFSGKYIMRQASIDDGLIHRPRVQWLTQYTNCEVGVTDVWFQATCNSDTLEGSDSEEDLSNERILEKSFFLSVENVKYNRDVPSSKHEEALTASHCLSVTGARCAWTTSNRSMAFALYESWRRAHILREQLSVDETAPNYTTNATSSQTPTKQKSLPGVGQAKAMEPSEGLSLSNLKSWAGNEFVEHIENSGFTTVYSEDQSTNIKEMELEAKSACKKEDVVHKSWHIKFVDCQMLLKGCETKGYVILSASKAEATKNNHVPIWKNETLLSKTTWSGALESMQYFATVSEEDETSIEEQGIQWLNKQSIQDEDRDDNQLRSDFMDDFGSVGGVLGKSGPDQLQRIVSKCTCEFYYVNYGDEPLEEIIDRMPKIYQDQSNIWSGNDESNAVDAFALIHHDLNVCTNSLQYSMILDILNNLLLFVDPTQKSRTENHLRLKYQLLLSNYEDQRKPITQLKSQIR